MNDIRNLEDRLETNSLLTNEALGAIFLGALRNPADGVNIFRLEADFVADDGKRAREVVKADGRYHRLVVIVFAISVIVSVLNELQEEMCWLSVELIGQSGRISQC